MEISPANGNLLNPLPAAALPRRPPPTFRNPWRSGRAACASNRLPVTRARAPPSAEGLQLVPQQCDQRPQRLGVEGEPAARRAEQFR